MIGDTPLRVADIGCDHGLLACHLAAAGHTVTAVDISAASLEKCRILAEKTGLAFVPPGGGPGARRAPLSFHLGNGLKTLDTPLDCAVIAGLGAGTIAGILRSARPHYAGLRFILCPASRPEQLRTRLRCLGFGITNEELVLEDRRYYPVIEAVGCQPPTGGQPASTADCQLTTVSSPADWLGPCLFATRHPLLPGLARTLKPKIEKSAPSLFAENPTALCELLKLLDEVSAW